MAQCSAPIALFATLALFATAGVGLGQTAPGEPEEKTTIPYAMTMGDMMSTLVQPRHIKLGLAGRDKNWPLAHYTLVEIRQAFAGITKAQPRFRGLPVSELVDAAMTQPISTLEIAIKQQDSAKFSAAYDQFTQGCNACHTALDHPYVVIKVPGESAFPDQEFKTR